MAKPQIELSLLDDVPWEPIPGFEKGVTQKTLSMDPETGSVTRLMHYDPGTGTPQRAVHDCWEEAYILEGSLVDLTLNQAFGKGSYCCRPPGMPHGPYRAPEGCTSLSMMYYLR